MFKLSKKMMLLVIILLSLASLAMIGWQQRRKSTAAAEQSNRERFVIIYRPGPKWQQGKTIFDLPLDKHFIYVQRLHREKRLITGGPFKDNQGAIAIIEATNEQEARVIMENDPIVLDGLATAEIHPWHIAFTGCVKSEQ